jgi:hypothetical protein
VLSEDGKTVEDAVVTLKAPKLTVARSQRTVQPDHEALCPEVERADRQVEPAADYKGCRRNDVAAIKRNWLIGQGLALAQMWL